MPTALELTSQKWKSYVDAARRRSMPRELTQTEHDTHEQLWTRIREAATMLKTQFGARRVILFGSLAHQARMTPDSDVDMAVEGLSCEAYWDAWRLVEDIICERPVDLIDLETVSPSLQRAIQRHGIEL